MKTIKIRRRDKWDWLTIVGLTIIFYSAFQIWGGWICGIFIGVILVMIADEYRV